MGTELDEGIRRRLDAPRTGHRARLGVLCALTGLVSALGAAASAQALTLASVDSTAALQTSATSAASSLASTARSLATSVPAAASASAAAGARSAATAAAASAPAAPGSAPVRSGPAAAGGAAPPPTVPTRARPVVQSARATLSSSSSGGSAAASSPPRNPVPTGPPLPVAAPSSVQDRVSGALRRAGLASGWSGSVPVPTTAMPPWPVVGAGGPGLNSAIVFGIGRATTSQGGVAAALSSVFAGSRLEQGAAALGGSAGQLVPVLLGARGTGSGRRSAGRRARAHAVTAGRFGEARPGRRSERALLVLAPAAATAVESSAGPSAAGPAARGRLGARRSSRGAALSAGPIPASPAPLVPAPFPTGPAAAAGLGSGLGGTAVVLFLFAAIWLLLLVGCRIPLEVSAWRETLLSLRLERPG